MAQKDDDAPNPGLLFGEDWADLGLRLRDLRLREGFTVRELALKAGLDKNTVVRAEKGLRVSIKSLRQICHALGTGLERQLFAFPRQADVRVTRAQEVVWTASWSGQEEAVVPEGPQHFNEAQKRNLLGTAGVQPVFNGLINCQLRGGRMVPCVMELFGPSKMVAHLGEEFLFVLRGSVQLMIGKESFTLGVGDSAMFWSGIEHSYAPLKPVKEGQEPPLILSVRIDGIAGTRSSKKSSGKK